MEVQVTIAEAVTMLAPPMTETQLRQIVGALAIPPAGTHRNGRAGRPAPTYQWTEITRLHAALMPWLQLPG